MPEKKEIEYKIYPILFVDDEEMTVTSFARLFSDDFTIYTATNAKDALSLLQAHPNIAVIVADQRMPGINGVDLLILAREVTPHAIRILVTAYSDMAVVTDAINKGNVYRYITKPFNENDFRYSILQALDYYRVVKDRDRLYSEKIETVKKMARLNRLSSIGVLAAGMAHEINNPLVAISTFLQMLPEKKSQMGDREYWNDFYSVTTTEIKRIKDLISQLLSYSKGADASKLYSKEADLSHPVNLNLLIQRVVVFLKGQAKEKKIHFDLALAHDLPQGQMDEEKIRQVIINLTLNAIQATTSGKITLRTAYHRDENYIEFTVSDTGYGISDRNLEQLFSPFFTTKEPNEGMGLGLTTCHHILDEHRGNIDVRSKLGIGTTVIVQLPLDPRDHDRRRIDRRTDP